MLHALGPAQVADVDQAVDAVFDLDKRAEIGQVAHACLQRSRPPGYFSCKLIPWIGRELPHTERDAPLRGIHAEHNALRPDRQR